MAAPFGPILVVGFCPVPVAVTFYGGDMGTHHHAEHPWRVGVSGDTRGAGVLLDERHVLTCAHVVGGEDERVSVASSVCLPEWRTGARVVPGSWVFGGGDTRRGDVALLELDDPAPCGAHARLWCAPRGLQRTQQGAGPSRGAASACTQP